MIGCPSCGFETDSEFAFCPRCGTRLAAPTARQVAEERKVVTCLFCDLVGFTASSEAADPEDVDAMLTRYSAMARTAIEAYGGTVEKFIGDAVVGIFGAPVAHEDDPERAVRAGLDIVERAAALETVGGAPLRLRVGVNTGEALVRLGVVAESGERLLSGDAVNTASRLQAVAPEMGVAVGLTTYRATSVVFDYAELEPARLKGKAESVHVFHARAARARFGTDLTRSHDSPFIGREIDLALLKGVFEKAAAASAPQFVLVTGEPGLGKSRLVAELFNYIDAKADLITWRQGRCLPYGEGITFWALGEIVKAHAGVLDSDSNDVAAAKLEHVLPEGGERSWFRQRLLPLLGLGAGPTAEQDELFTAWRRFLEQLGDVRPTVLVFEDLHWADGALLAFLEHLADRAERVPLLVIGTARPELFDRHPNFTNGLRNITAVNLAPLSADETARLLSALLDTTVMPVDLQQPILDRAEGNPLYAEEFVRLLKDKELLDHNGSSWQLKPGAEVPFPESVQAMIAARLDLLGADAKSMLADAAVVGKVFWAGAVAQMGERGLTEVTEVLRDLARKELVRPARRSSIEGEAEYSFCHVLARDVAYRQLPRASRAARHVAAARWVEAQAPARVEDLADVLAYHYATALDLARAAGQVDLAELESAALKFSSLAGQRALGLDTPAAVTSFERALGLTPPGHPGRASALARFGAAAFHAGRAEAGSALEEAIELFSSAGDHTQAASAMGQLSVVLFQQGDRRWATLPTEALSLLEPMGASPDLVGALIAVARVETLQGRFEAGLAFADRALAIAETVGMDRPPRALNYRGLARCGRGDHGGLDDLREALALATESGQAEEAALLYNNLAVGLDLFEGPRPSHELSQVGIEFARARGLTDNVNWMTVGGLHQLRRLGGLDEALQAAELWLTDRRSDSWIGLYYVHTVRLQILALRGEVETGRDSLEWLESRIDSAGGTAPQYLLASLGVSALARWSLGDAEATAALLARARDIDGVQAAEFFPSLLPVLVRTALGVRRPELAAGIVAGYAPASTYGEHALVTALAALDESAGQVAEAAERYADAARRWDDFGVAEEEGFAQVGRGRCLLRLSRSGEAATALLAARGIFETLRAAPTLREIDLLLSRATSVSS